MLALARDYSGRRTIGKSKLSNMPLQVRVLAHLEVTHRANLAFYLSIAELFSKEHAGNIGEDDANLLRVFTPILKLFTGKQAMEVVTEGLESFGGMGYIEGTMLPTLMRDAQVLSIWEGTTNVLCYDFVRALLKKENSIMPLQSLIKFFVSAFERIGTGEVNDKTFISSNKQIITSYLEIVAKLEEDTTVGFRKHLGELRTYCFGLARIYIATLLQLRALSSMRQNDIEISNRWTKRGLFISEDHDAKTDRRIGLDLDDTDQPRGVGDVDARGRLRARF
jgi:hypothetical protein